MRKGLYPKLAVSGMKKNRRLYVPYILACVGMVMMFYIVSFLCTSETVRAMKGGDMIQNILSMGRNVIAVFSVIFLFYTNAFLMRRRKTEFGLYNILGMGKWNLARILLWESLIIAAVALAGGLAAGILFSKVGELVMVNILQTQTDYSLHVDPGSVLFTVMVFVPIFFLLLLNALRQIHLANPIALLRSENVGEKPPRANWLLAVAGLVVLGAAYWLALSIQYPLEAFMWFFVAVVMVIVGTYLLFIAGSVAFCRLLQKNKRYYYRTNHFVSVSSMIYRMKRNGAGLASICILSTMVLVMLSSTTCLYVGKETSLRNRYPRDIYMDVTFTDMELSDGPQKDQIRAAFMEVVKENGVFAEHILDYQMADMAGFLQDGRIDLDSSMSAMEQFSMGNFSGIWQVFLVSLEDYNRLMGENVTLEPGEVLMYTTRHQYEGDTIAVGDGAPMKVKMAKGFIKDGTDSMQIIPSMYLFLADPEEVLAPLNGLADFSGNKLVNYHWYYGYDMSAEDQVQIDVLRQTWDRMEGLLSGNGFEEIHMVVDGIAWERADFYGLYGGLLFLGILLGIVFLFGAVLIIYYKQVSEGYEDQSRFGIMQKVGMTKKEIRKSINSQVLTVFFLPLVTAGIHMAFAFPLIDKMLVLFSLTDVWLLIGVTAGCFLVFALFYVLVYKATSRVYYDIVSGDAAV